MLHEKEQEERDRDQGERGWKNFFLSSPPYACVRGSKKREREREGEREGLYTHSLFSYLFIINNFLFIYEFIFL